MNRRCFHRSKFWRLITTHFYEMSNLIGTRQSALCKRHFARCLAYATILTLALISAPSRINNFRISIWFRCAAIWTQFSPGIFEREKKIRIEINENQSNDGKFELAVISRTKYIRLVCLCYAVLWTGYYCCCFKFFFWWEIRVKIDFTNNTRSIVHPP